MSTERMRRLVVSALAAAVLAACDPGYTRPRLVPFPEADTAGVVGDIATVTSRVVQALEAEGVPVARLHAHDGWLVTEWLDTADFTPADGPPLGLDAVRIRGWVDPGGYGVSRVTLEGVWRPLADPSLPERELERPVPPDHPASLRIRRALARLRGPALVPVGPPPGR